MRQQHHPAEVSAFDVAWACQVVARVSEALRSEWKQRENQLTWRVYQASLLKPLIGREPEPTCEVLATTLQTSTATAHRHRAKARREFRRVLRLLLAEYAGSAKDIESELAELAAVIRDAPQSDLSEALQTIDAIHPR